MRTSILDEVRKVIEANKTDVDSAESTTIHIQPSKRPSRRNTAENGK